NAVYRIAWARETGGVDVVIIDRLVDRAHSDITDVQHKPGSKLPLHANVVLACQRKVDRFVARRIEIRTLQRRRIEIAGLERERPINKRSLQTWVIRARTETDRVRIRLSFLHRMNELVATDSIIENDGPTTDDDALFGLPGKTKPRSKGGQ